MGLEGESLSDKVAYARRGNRYLHLRVGNSAQVRVEKKVPFEKKKIRVFHSRRRRSTASDNPKIQFREEETRSFHSRLGRLP